MISFALPILKKVSTRTPPHMWFAVSALFHYLAPSFAVLLFPHMGVLGVVWMRMASASIVLGCIANPLRTFARLDFHGRVLLILLGISFAAMNTSFYFALDRIPMSLVAAIEFVGIIGVALYGMRTVQNLMALLTAVAGVLLIIDVKFEIDIIGLTWALVNTIFFVAYIILGHKAAQAGVGGGIEVLSAAMSVAFICCFPIGVSQAIVAFNSIELVLAGIGVGICSSVIPYVCDQIAMSRLPRATFALLLSLLPAVATIVAAIVLSQIPSVSDVIGIALVMAGIAIHKPNQANM